MEIDPTLRLSIQPVRYLVERRRGASRVRENLTAGLEQGWEVPVK